MATHELLAGSTDLSSAASWSSGIAPASWTNGDNVLIRDGSQTVTAGLTSIGVNIGWVKITGDFKGSLGDGSSVVFGGTVASITIDGGGGDFYISAGTCAALTVKQTRGGLFHLSGGTTALYTQERGQVYIGASAIVTEGHFNGGNATVQYNATGFTKFVNNGANVALYRSAATAKQIFGRTEAVKNAAVSTVLDIAGGTWNHRGGNITLVEGYAGTFTDANNRGDFTISSLKKALHRFRYIDKQGSGTITVSATVEFGGAV